MDENHFSLTTENLANWFHVKPGAIYQAHQRHGQFNGIVPIKLPSGRLLWPRSDVADVLRGGPIDLRSEHEAVQALCRIARDSGLPVCRRLVEFARGLCGSHPVASSGDRVNDSVRLARVTGGCANRLAATLSSIDADPQNGDVHEVSPAIDQVHAASNAMFAAWTLQRDVANEKAELR